MASLQVAQTICLCVRKDKQALCRAPLGFIVSFQRECDRRIGVQQCRVKCRQIEMLRAYQETDFRAAQDHAVGAGGLCGGDDIEVTPPRMFPDHAATEFVEDDGLWSSKKVRNSSVFGEANRMKSWQWVPAGINGRQ